MKHYRLVFFAILFLPCKTYATNMIYKDSMPIALMGLSEIWSSGDSSGCENRRGTFKVQEIAYEGVSEVVGGIRVKPVDATNNVAPFLIKLDANKLSNLDRSWVSTLVSKGNDLLIEYAACGSGGFSYAQNIYLNDGSLSPQSQAANEDASWVGLITRLQAEKQNSKLGAKDSVDSVGANPQSWASRDIQAQQLPVEEGSLKQKSVPDLSKMSNEEVTAEINRLQVGKSSTEENKPLSPSAVLEVKPTDNNSHISRYVAIIFWPLIIFGNIIHNFYKKPNRSSSNGDKSSKSDVPLTRSRAFEILGLKEDATKKEIHAARKRLLKGLHPDAGGSNVLAALINQAADLLLK